MKKIEQLEKEILKINRLLQDLGAKNEVVDGKVKSFGNGGHVIISKRHLNKKVKVLIGK